METNVNVVPLLQFTQALLPVLVQMMGPCMTTAYAHRLNARSLLPKLTSSRLEDAIGHAACASAQQADKLPGQ